MLAAVTLEPGSPNTIKLREVSIPKVKTGWVLIEVKAFGLNRSELFTRRGDSPGVSFPRIQGIECVGVIADAPLQHLQKRTASCCDHGRHGAFLRWRVC
jgi:NADPH2:quinone reductase